MTVPFRGPTGHLAGIDGIWDVQSNVWARHPVMHAVGYCTCHRKRVISLMVRFALAAQARQK